MVLSWADLGTSVGINVLILVVVFFAFNQLRRMSLLSDFYSAKRKLSIPFRCAHRAERPGRRPATAVAGARSSDGTCVDAWCPQRSGKDAFSGVAWACGSARDAQRRVCTRADSSSTVRRSDTSVTALPGSRALQLLLAPWSALRARSCRAARACALQACRTPLTGAAATRPTGTHASARRARAARVITCCAILSWPRVVVTGARRSAVSAQRNTPVPHRRAFRVVSARQRLVLAINCGCIPQMSVVARWRQNSGAGRRCHVLRHKRRSYVTSLLHAWAAHAPGRPGRGQMLRPELK